MFSVHGVTGQTFRGSLEHLIQVPGAFAARHARGVLQEGDELGAEFELVRRRLAGQEESPPDPRYAQAAAYARALHPDNPREPVRHAYQVMSREVLTLDAADTVEAAWHRLTQRGVHQAPVVAAGQGVVGLVSERELLTVIDLVERMPSGGLHRPVREVMMSPVISLVPTLQRGNRSWTLQRPV